MIVFSQQLCLSFASSESKCVLPLVCLYLRHIVTQMPCMYFYPSVSQYLFLSVYTLLNACWSSELQEHFTCRQQHLTNPLSSFIFLSFFSPEGQYEIIRQPSMLTSVWIYSWCSLEMPGNKPLLSHRPVALVPVHFSSPPAEREERQGRENERTRCPRRWN